MGVYGIDMGHSLSGAGTGASGLLSEVIENRKVGKRLIEMLKEKGHTVVDCSIDKASSTNEQLSGIVKKANAQKLDLFVSIHFNDGGGHGTEVYTCSTASSTAKTKAKEINSAVVGSCNFTNRGVKTSNLYVLKNTVAPAVLVEVCFVDSAEDKDKLNTEAVAKALFKGITGVDYVAPFTVPSGFDSVQYLINNPDVLKVTEANSTFKAIDHYKNYGQKEGRSWAKPTEHICSPTEKSTSTGASSVKYRVVCGTYADKNNALKQQEDLKKAGFDSFLVAIN